MYDFSNYNSTFVTLMLDENTPFSKMSIFSLFDPGAVLSLGFQRLLFLLGRGLTAIIDAITNFAASSYKLLSFSGDEKFKDLYNIFSKYLFIPIAICLVIIAVRFLIGGVNRNTTKQLIQNLGILFFVLCIMPSVFSFMNNVVIGDNFLNEIHSPMVNSERMKEKNESGSQSDSLYDETYSAGIDSVFNDAWTVKYENSGKISLGNLILRSNTTDYLYLYNNCTLLNTYFQKDTDVTDTQTGACNNYDEIVAEIRKVNKNYCKSDEAKAVTFSAYTFDPTALIWDANDPPDMFKYKIEGYTTSWTSHQDGAEGKTHIYRTSQMRDGLIGESLFGEHYQRYHINYLTVFVELIATIIMFFSIGYSVIKLIFELLIHQLFGPMMAAADLTGGQRIKKYLSSIIGCYAALIISAITIMLYMAAVNFLSEKVEDDLTRALITLVMAIVFMDGPNIIARYFGINTGIRGGMAMATLGMAKIAHVAATPTRVAGNVGQSTLNSRVKDRIDAPKREAEKKAEKAEAEKTRKAEKAETEKKRQEERKQQKQQEYDDKMDNFTNKYGTHGDYEKYQNHIPYDKENEGSQQNKDAITQAAAFNAIDQERQGKIAEHETSINGGADMVGATESDREDAIHENPANIRDAKQGIYDGVAKRAESSGGTKKAYRKAAENALVENGAVMPNGKPDEEYVNYLADASFSRAHSQQIRIEAARIQHTSSGRISDEQAYAMAMDRVGGSYHFDENNKERIAAAEIREFGSLREGDIYNNRPNSPDELENRRTVLN